MCLFTGTLQIVRSEEEDQGKYECVAENSIGTEFSKPTSLYVKGQFSNHSIIIDEYSTYGDGNARTYYGEFNESECEIDILRGIFIHV